MYAFFLLILIVYQLTICECFVLQYNACDKSFTLSASNVNVNVNANANDDLDAMYMIPETRTVGIKDLGHHIKILDHSLKILSGKGVFERMNIQIQPPESISSPTYKDILYNTRYVLISHGTQTDPIYNFGNVACLQAFARTWNDLCIIPSRESVVLLSKDETKRIALMSNVTKNGFVDGATGVRVRGDDKFIRLVDAVVWNCYDENGDYYGQAAFFDREKTEILTNIDE